MGAEGVGALGVRVAAASVGLARVLVRAAVNAGPAAHAHAVELVRALVLAGAVDRVARARVAVADVLAALEGGLGHCGGADGVGGGLLGEALWPKPSPVKPCR